MLHILMSTSPCLHMHSFPSLVGLRWAFLYIQSHSLPSRPHKMTRQQSYSTQQSNICPISTFGYLSQMESVTLGGNKACYKPPSVGIGYENVSLCSPRPWTITQRKQKLVRTMRDDWLAALHMLSSHRELLLHLFCCWYLLADILLSLFWVMLMHWDTDIFLLKPDLRRTCAIQKLERTTPLWTWKFCLDNFIACAALLSCCMQLKAISAGNT